MQTTKSAAIYKDCLLLFGFQLKRLAISEKPLEKIPVETLYHVHDAVRIYICNVCICMYAWILLMLR